MPKSVFDYLRNHLFKCRAVCFKARIGMNIDEPRLEILVHDKLALDKFEARTFFGLIENPIVCLCKGRNTLLHNGKGASHKTILICIDSVKMILKLSEVYLIARLVLSELIVLYLHALCGKVAELVVKCLDIEGLAGCAYHSFTMQVSMRLLFLG